MKQYKQTTSKPLGTPILTLALIMRQSPPALHLSTPRGQHREINNNRTIVFIQPSRLSASMQHEP